jgi:hypothetical protein
VCRRLGHRELCNRPDDRWLHVQGYPTVGVRPWSRTESGRCFDRLPGVVVLELGGAQVAERGVKSPHVVDVVDEAGQVGGDVFEGLVVIRYTASTLRVFMKLSAFALS